MYYSTFFVTKYVRLLHYIIIYITLGRVKYDNRMRALCCHESDARDVIGACAVRSQQWKRRSKRFPTDIAIILIAAIYDIAHCVLNTSATLYNESYQ